MHCGADLVEQAVAGTTSTVDRCHAIEVGPNYQEYNARPISSTLGTFPANRTAFSPHLLLPHLTLFIHFVFLPILLVCAFQSRGKQPPFGLGRADSALFASCFFPRQPPAPQCMMDDSLFSAVTPSLPRRSSVCFPARHSRQLFLKYDERKARFQPHAWMSAYFGL